jgi:hypothetical protein
VSDLRLASVGLVPSALQHISSSEAFPDFFSGAQGIAKFAFVEADAGRSIRTRVPS